MSNGCGCEKGFLRFVKPPLAKYFYVPCCLHDNAYDVGGTASKRKQSDQYLYIGMVQTVLKREQSPLKATLYIGIALLYYVCVRAFGRFYFNYKK